MSQNHASGITSAARSKRTWHIVIVHLLIVVGFFVASFYLGNFA